MNKLNSMTSIAALLAFSVVGVTTQVSATLVTTETHVNKSADAKCGEAKCGATKKAADAKCGANKKAADGKCGADKKVADGKCGAK